MDRRDTPLAWEVEAWAIRTPSGVAFVMIDGPPEAWTGRAGAVRQIAELLRLSPPPELPEPMSSATLGGTGR